MNNAAFVQAAKSKLAEARVYISQAEQAISFIDRPDKRQQPQPQPQLFRPKKGMVYHTNEVQNVPGVPRAGYLNGAIAYDPIKRAKKISQIQADLWLINATYENRNLLPDNPSDEREIIEDCYNLGVKEPMIYSAAPYVNAVDHGAKCGAIRLYPEVGSNGERYTVNAQLNLLDALMNGGTLTMSGTTYTYPGALNAGYERLYLIGALTDRGKRDSVTTPVQWQISVFSNAFERYPQLHGIIFWVPWADADLSLIQEICDGIL